MFIHPKQEKNVPNVFWFVRGIHLTAQCTPLLLGLQCKKSDNSMIQRFMLSQQFPRLTLEWSKNCFNVWLFPHQKGSTAADSKFYAPNRWANSLVIMTQPVSICFFQNKNGKTFLRQNFQGFAWLFSNQRDCFWADSTCYVRTLPIGELTLWSFMTHRFIAIKRQHGKTPFWDKTFSFMIFSGSATHI